MRVQHSPFLVYNCRMRRPCLKAKLLLNAHSPWLLCGATEQNTSMRFLPCDYSSLCLHFTLRYSRHAAGAACASFFFSRVYFPCSKAQNGNNPSRRSLKKKEAAWSQTFIAAISTKCCVHALRQRRRRSNRAPRFSTRRLHKGAKSHGSVYKKTQAPKKI